MKKVNWLYLIPVLFIFCFFISIEFTKAQTGNLKIYFFDVGQGDSVLIKTPSGRDILVDGGPDNTVLQRLNEVLPFWDRHIDFVILTHPHADHIDGLYEILKRYKVDEVLEPDLKNEPENMVYFNKLAGLTEVVPPGVPRGTTSISPIAGESVFVENDLDIKVLHPLILQLEEENINDTSIVFQLIYKGNKFLFTGDMTSEVEAKIFKSDLDSDFLKVGHHGSRYSSSAEFLAKVTPLVSIISVGEGNSFGHPTRDTLDRLGAVGSKILRTDKNGSVEIDVFEGGEWEISCSKGCR